MIFSRRRAAERSLVAISTSKKSQMLPPNSLLRSFMYFIKQLTFLAFIVLFKLIQVNRLVKKVVDCLRDSCDFRMEMSYMHTLVFIRN